VLSWGDQSREVHLVAKTHAGSATERTACSLSRKSLVGSTHLREDGGSSLKRRWRAPG
jgi:hypothetical protein